MASSGVGEAVWAPSPSPPELPYRELFLALAEALPDAVFTKDLQGRYTFINAAGARYLGLSVEEILGRTDSELLPAEQARRTQELDCRALLSRHPLSIVVSERMAGVQREWCSTKGQLRRPDGTVVGMFGLARDLLPHRRSEAARRQSEALFRAAASSGPDAFFIFQADGEGVRLLHLNALAESLLGHEARGAEGRLLSDFPHAAFIAPPHLREQVWRTGQSHDEEVAQVLRGLGRRWFRRQLRAVGDCLAVTVRDITEQRETEVRQRLNERLASIGRLAAGVAHEINNPLAFVSSNLGFIETELRRLPLPEEDLRELLEALSDTREGTERMRLIVQGLQSLSRGETATPQPLALHEALESSIRLVSGRLGGGNRLVRDYGEVPRVLGNSVQLAQVFTNLLVNAAQALPPSGGEIRLVTRLLGDSVAVVEVRDTGCGIPAEHLERIFEPFFTTKPVGEGTGLGLSLCHDIIRGLGGVMTVDSLVGEGSTFRVFLPVVDTGEARAQGEDGALAVVAAGTRLE
ncbi:ATP-binding protein [Archangium lansingense]|uniref:histidine kinase n=1 Tax=Archangium lansingense TaxID=2995310 RepID=A0ABT3ZUB4_9BACT|nr:ATP-binding protein [Archangium lansinium]MCY1072998.1 PAS domain-containing protein [Archangium lansinium]